jgi:hypothetical protein
MLSDEGTYVGIFRGTRHIRERGGSGLRGGLAGRSSEVAPRP